MKEREREGEKKRDRKGDTYSHICLYKIACKFAKIQANAHF